MLAAALERGAPVIPVYIWAPDEEGDWPPGAASRWWLHHSLEELDRALRNLGSRLIVRRGKANDTIKNLVEDTGARAVYWCRRYEPAGMTQEDLVRQALKDIGIDQRDFNTGLLFEPGDVLNKSGKPFQVFTPFWRACLNKGLPANLIDAPSRILPPDKWPGSLLVGDLNLLPKADWAGGLRSIWRPGEASAGTILEKFLDGAIKSYPEHRDRPDLRGVSGLSPHLHFGEISPSRIVHSVQGRLSVDNLSNSASHDAFVRQLIWREFAYYLLYHFPHTPEQPLHIEFAEFPWQADQTALNAWQQGVTGYPLIDAGMRELWNTGYMHNRVRMVVASFLVKDLLIPWQSGSRWFWDTLVDADLANNTLGWQWTAGCGADAAPYFRIFNPAKQGEKFDPVGNYVRRWVPELANLPSDWIHRPWEAPLEILSRAGVVLGKSYPHRIVDHDLARRQALAALAAMKGQRGITRDS